jgi:hypothetical protein
MLTHPIGKPAFGWTWVDGEDGSDDDRIMIGRVAYDEDELGLLSGEELATLMLRGGRAAAMRRDPELVAQRERDATMIVSCLNTAILCKELVELLDDDN